MRQRGAKSIRHRGVTIPTAKVGFAGKRLGVGPTVKASPLTRHALDPFGDEAGKLRATRGAGLSFRIGYRALGEVRTHL